MARIHPNVESTFSNSENSRIVVLLRVENLDIDLNSIPDLQIVDNSSSNGSWLVSVTRNSIPALEASTDILLVESWE